MTVGVIGIKLGMSRLFEKTGDSLPVTVVQAKPNSVCQIKTQDKDGYSALQLTIGIQKPQRLSKSLRGHYAKNKIQLARHLKEIRIDSNQEEKFNVGDKLGVSQFVAGQKVDASGVSKGKGFAGTIKRWNFAAQDATHGNSISHRHAGSTGQCQFPGKVWKGKKMAGQYGNTKVTSQGLQVAMVDEEQNILLIKGSIPGPPGTTIVVTPAVKQTPEELEFVTKKLAEKAQAAENAETAESESSESKATENAGDAKENSKDES